VINDDSRSIHVSSPEFLHQETTIRDMTNLKIIFPVILFSLLDLRVDGAALASYGATVDEVDVINYLSFYGYLPAAKSKREFTERQLQNALKRLQVRRDFQ
jgi:hypothetical protein